ncbi:MAG: ABC transporter substrate-binding protein [Myxococcota bacterium]
MTDTLKLGLEWFLNPDHLPFLIGLEKGWFEAAGVALELVEPTEHLDAFDAIRTGALDLAITEPIHLVEDVAKGHEVVGFARLLHTNGGVMTLESSGIERPRDMAGKRIQYPGAPGPGGLAIVSTMIEADGGEPGALTPVNRGFHHTDALIEGAADAATLAFYNFEIVEAGHRGHPARLFALKDWGIPDFCQLILITTRERYAAKRAALRRLIEVVGRGMDFIHQHPDEARALYFRRTETAPDDVLMSAIFRATVPCFTFDLTMSGAYWRGLSSWAARRGLIEAAVAPEACWNNDLAVSA